MAALQCCSRIAVGISHGPAAGCMPRKQCAAPSASPSSPSAIPLHSSHNYCNVRISNGAAGNSSLGGWERERNLGLALTARAIGPSGASITVAEGPSDGAATAVKEDATSLEDLKEMLVDNFFGVERGLRASSETRGEIVEIITQLEAKNPTAAPTEAVNLLNGKWILGYTSFSEIFPLLAAGNLPLVKVGEISQTFDSSAFTVQNRVSFSGPLGSTSFSNSGIFEVRSPKRVQVKFEEGVIGTPQLTDSIEIPDSVNILGQNINLTALQGLASPLQDVASTVARAISGQPPLKFPIQSDRAQSWLLTTYLDEDLRISRGDGGGLFVLIKEGSSLLSLL